MPLLISGLKKNSTPVIALTAGEPAGIGPDLCIQLAQQPRREQLVVVANARMLEERAQQLKLPWRSLPAGTTSLAAGEMAVLAPPDLLTLINHFKGQQLLTLRGCLKMAEQKTNSTLTIECGIKLRKTF